MCGGKKRFVDSCELFFFVEPLTNGKKLKRGLSWAQISVHRASAEVVFELEVSRLP